MEFAYDHVLIESSSLADESSVHTAAPCVQNETRSYTSCDEQSKAKHTTTTPPPMLICADEPADVKAMIPPDSLMTFSDAVLSVKNLFNVTKEITNWFTLGLQLDIPTHKLQTIEHDHRVMENSKHEMLHFWVHSDPEASWEKLAAAVEKMEFRRISERIRKDYIPLSQHSLAMARDATPLPIANVRIQQAPARPKLKRGTRQVVRYGQQPAVFDGVVAKSVPPPGVVPKSLPPPAPAKQQQSDHPIDTNVLAVKFSVLREPGHLHTGDAIVCCNEKCTAVLNHLSTLTEEVGKKEKVWICEFCGTKNEVDVVAEEIPKEEGVLFKITTATPAVASMARDSLVEFCVDTSGSMCVTTEVSGRFDLIQKGCERLERLQQIYSGDGIQHIFNQRQDVTYVSRLQSIQAAVDHQLTTLARDSPSQRVAVVTFGDEVTVSGGDRAKEMVVTGDRLWKHDALVQIGDTIPLPLPIKETKAYLSKKIFGLEEDGQTTLGPALLLSVQLASHAPGSKVIVCTDGLANRGVGNLDNPRTLESARSFYRELGAAAKSKSVTVSVLTIKGTECGLIELGQVANITGGEVNIVDPTTVMDEFTNILATPIIATGVNITMILHNYLFFRTGSSEESTSVLNVPVGNVKADTELTYEFGVKSTSAKPTIGDDKLNTAQSIPELIIEDAHYMPFQLQIRYTDSDGAQCMLVLTRARPVTSDIEVAKQGINLKVLSCHFSHKTGTLATEGNYEEAEHYATSCIRDLRKKRCAMRFRRKHEFSALMSPDPEACEQSEAFLQDLLHKTKQIREHQVKRYIDEVESMPPTLCSDVGAEKIITACRATWKDIESAATKIETSDDPTQTTEIIDLHNEGYGFGFTLERDERGGSVILSVVSGGIAESDGRLQLGDQIAEINGESVAHLSHSDVVAKVKALGQGGDPIQLGVARTVKALGRGRDPIQLGATRMEQAPLESNSQISGESATLRKRPYSKNMESTSTELIAIELANEGYGFGFSIAPGENGDSMIKSLIPDGIAERDGRLQVGDRILEVNGENAAHLSYSDIVDRVKALGQGGETIQLGLARMGIKHVRFSTDV